VCIEWVVKITSLLDVIRVHAVCVTLTDMSVTCSLGSDDIPILCTGGKVTKEALVTADMVKSCQHVLNLNHGNLDKPMNVVRACESIMEMRFNSTKESDIIMEGSGRELGKTWKGGMIWHRVDDAIICGEAGGANYTTCLFADRTKHGYSIRNDQSKRVSLVPKKQQGSSAVVTFEVATQGTEHRAHELLNASKLD
jgi:hypothetical protein